MIDIHCHILPGLDNGPSTITESIAMARNAAKIGVNKIIATPHHRKGIYNNEPDEIIKVTDYVNGRLQEEKIPVKIYPGQETTIYEGFMEDLANGKILPLNIDTAYISIELSPEQIPKNMEKIIYDIQMAGYIPVISNPEMNSLIHNYPNILYRMVKNGALTNLAAGSMAGKNGKKVQKLAEKLLEANLIHFIGSNSHNSTRHGFKLAEAVAQVQKMDKRLSYQLIENNECLLLGKPITKEEPERIITKKWALFGK